MEEIDSRGTTARENAGALEGDPKASERRVGGAGGGGLALPGNTPRSGKGEKPGPERPRWWQPTLFEGPMRDLLGDRGLPSGARRRQEGREAGRARSLARGLARALGRAHAAGTGDGSLVPLADRLRRLSRTAAPDVAEALREWSHRQYAAAMLDGEGNVGIKATHKRRDGWQLMAEVTISNSHLPMLQSLQARFGGRIRACRNEHRVVHRLTWSRHGEIRALLTALLPHLRIKRRQARVMLAYLRARGPGRRVRLTRRDWQLADRMSVLNARSRYPGPDWIRPTERRRREEGTRR